MTSALVGFNLFEHNQMFFSPISFPLIILVVLKSLVLIFSINSNFWVICFLLLFWAGLVNGRPVGRSFVCYMMIKYGHHVTVVMAWVRVLVLLLLMYDRSATNVLVAYVHMYPSKYRCRLYGQRRIPKWKFEKYN